MPATSPGFESITSQSKPRAAPQRRYMRSSICAQSCASVPPAPAWMSRNALCESISPGNMRLKLEVAHRGLERAVHRRSMSRAARLVALGLGQLEQLSSVVDRLGGAIDLPDLRRQASALAPELLRTRRVRPDSRVLAARGRLPRGAPACDRTQRNPRKELTRSPEVFELLLQLIDFHGCPDAKRGWRARASRPRAVSRLRAGRDPPAAAGASRPGIRSHPADTPAAPRPPAAETVRPARGD